MLLVDDEKVLISSANINDRSLLGNRDSEIGVIVDDENKIISKMNGELYSASNFAYSLRIRLWREKMM